MSIFKIKKDKNVEKNKINKDAEYTALTPIDDMPNGKEYLNALKWALSNKKIKNIALAGPYGSGKSSIIETFLHKNSAIEKETLRVSMATFVGDNIDNDGNVIQKKTQYNSDEIEKEILKQLFYKVKHYKIPQSRYRKLHKISFWKILICTLLTFLAVSIIGYVFWPATIEYVCNKITIAGTSLHMPHWLSYICSGAFVLGVLIAFTFLYRGILSRFNVKEIKLTKDVSVKKEEEAKESVFNKNMDEIVYFFEATKYRYIFFEDFDRLENSSIFIHLRELNTVLNNYDAIKEPIVFLYAVRDDIFTNTDRTKFFDFIIPVVPVINSTNSGEMLIDILNSAKEKGIEYDISQSFILDISPYISDMRILQNIYNEFIVYKETLGVEQSLELHDEPMFAVMVFKNLYPKEFSKIQNEIGIIKTAFDDKENFVSSKRKELQIEIEEKTEQLEGIKSEFLNTRKSLKGVFLCEITNFSGMASNFTPKGEASVRSSDFLNDSYDISKWVDSETCSGTYTSWYGGGSPFTCQNFSEVYNSFLKRFDQVAIIEDDKIEKSKIAIENLKKQANELASYSLKTLIEKFNVEDILSGEVCKNKLLVFLIRRGYIDEKYTNYINYFKGSTITKDDMNFILSVKNLEPKPYTYKLTKTDMVIQKLQLYEFEQPSVLNFDLLEYMLSVEKHNTKLEVFINQLTNCNDEIWSFIDEFIETTSYKQKFIKLLASKWDGMWDYLVDNTVLTYERLNYYLYMILSYATTESILAMNSNNKLKDFFFMHEDILTNMSDVESGKMIEIIDCLKVLFTNVCVSNVPAAIVNYIFDNNLYVINSTMIQRIVEYKNKNLVPDLRTKNYSTILKLGFVPLIEYIRENISDYTREVVFSALNTDEDINAVVDLLTRNVDNTNYIGIIEKLNFVLEDISICCQDLIRENADYVKAVWNEILIKNKIKTSWLNLMKYWHNFGFADELITYIEKNIDMLLKEDSSCINDESFISEFIDTNISDDAFGKLLTKLPWDNFDKDLASLDANKILTMIHQRYFNFSLERYNEVNEINSKLAIEFILNNQSEYMEVRDDIVMSAKLMQALILSERMDNDKIITLLEEYCDSCINEAIAKEIVRLNLSISLKVFSLIWQHLTNSEKISLMMNNLDNIDAKTFETCFSEIEGIYSDFSDRKYRHDVMLEYTDDNLKLAQRLKAVNYITSFQEKQKTEYDPVQSVGKEVKYIYCRVKAMG